MSLDAVADELSDRLISIFLLDEEGRRPCYGDSPRFQSDPAWRDHLMFHEYFHGDTGAGLGASHQTGWTGLVANLILRRAGQRTFPEVSYPRKWLTSSIAGGVALGLVVGFSVKAVSGDDDDSKTNVDTGTTVVAVVDTSAVATSTLPPTAVVPPETTVAPPATTAPAAPPGSVDTLPVDTTRRRRPRPTTTLPPPPPPPPPTAAPTTPFVTPPPIQVGS